MPGIRAHSARGRRRCPDRSLGRIKVPSLLRASGLRPVTLAEHYGIPADETIVDEEWLELAGSSGWAVPPQRRVTQTRCLIAVVSSGHHYIRRWIAVISPIAPDADLEG